MRQTGALHAVTDFREITENPDIDIVDICSPNEHHCEALLSAMAHGKDIYCDKPIVANPEQAAAVAEALKSYRGIGQMTLQNRFFPATIRAKELIEDGRIGEILEFNGEYLHSGSRKPETALLDWKVGAGSIADLGTHIIDFMDWILGGFTEVLGQTHTAYPERPAYGDPTRRVKVTGEDNMFVLARVANGACGCIRASKIATGTEDSFSFTINGSKGAIRLDPMDFDHLYYYDGDAPDAPHGGTRGWTAIDCVQRYEKPAGFPTPKAPLVWMRSHVQCLYTFLKSVHHREQYGADLHRGLYIQHITECIRISARERRWINL
jgi:predicted dehydrogenase